MIKNAFDLPTEENGYLPTDISEYKRLSEDERIEFAIMMLMKDENPNTQYTFNYVKQLGSCEYYICEYHNINGVPVVELTLKAFREVCKSYLLEKNEDNYFDKYESKPLALLEVCEFLYSITRKGVIDNILEIL